MWNRWRGVGRARGLGPRQSVLSGRSAAGTPYDLRFRARPGRIRRERWWLVLLVRRPGEEEWVRGFESGGPVQREDHLALALSGHCGEPRETFAVGWLPSRGAALALVPRDAQGVEARIAPGEYHGRRLFLAPLAGTVGDAHLEVRDSSGETILREALAWRDDPCGDLADGVSFLRTFDAQL